MVKNAVPRQAAHLGLADRLRALIESGELKPGHRFAPTQALAKEWKTYPLAVHNAFQILADAGLVERLHRQGTFVSRSSAALGTVAIYLGTDIMLDEHLKFARAVYADLTKNLRLEGVRVESLFDFRSKAEACAPWSQLVKALERREYQGVIVLCADAPRMRWLNSLPTKIVSGFDLRSTIPEFAVLALHSLAAKGCRSVGSISAFQNESRGFHAALEKAAAELGVDLRPEWSIRPDNFIPGPEIEPYAYQQFLKLWQRPVRPDGLIVYPDILVPSVLAAMQRLRLNAPEDLRLAFHKNREIPLACPFPASFIVTSATEYAAGLLQQLRAKVAGHSPAPFKLSCVTEEHTPK